MPEAAPTHRLYVYCAGPGFSDRIKIESADLGDFVPDIVERSGLEYERYGTDEAFEEVRRDYVVSRSCYPIPPPPPRRETDEEDLMKPPEPPRSSRSMSRGGEREI